MNEYKKRPRWSPNGSQKTLTIPRRPPEVSKMSYSSMTRNRSAKKSAAGDRWGPRPEPPGGPKRDQFLLKNIILGLQSQKK